MAVPTIPWRFLDRGRRGRRGESTAASDRAPVAGDDGNRDGGEQRHRSLLGLGFPGAGKRERARGGSEERQGIVGDLFDHQGSRWRGGHGQRHGGMAPVPLWHSEEGGEEERLTGGPHRLSFKHLVFLFPFQLKPVVL